jgi:hypothetical protein
MAVVSSRVFMLEDDYTTASYMQLALDASWQKYSQFYSNASQCTVATNRLATGGTQWCDTNSTIMLYSTNDYETPLLQVNQSLDHFFKIFFPRGNVFHKVSKFLFQPTARLTAAARVYETLVSDCIAGMQLRSKKTSPPDHAWPYLEPAQYAAAVRAVAQGESGNVFVAADADLFGEVAGLLPDRAVWWTNETQATINTTQAAGGNPGSDLSAFLDVLILSRCKHIVITAGSSFGVLAAGLSNKYPIHIVRGKHEHPFMSPWFWASVTSEPCMWKASREWPSDLSPEVRVALKTHHPLYWYFEQCN